jgi:hypothetical protein
MIEPVIPPPERISKKREQRRRLIEAMLHESVLEKAAAAAGISPTTAWRIRKTPEFQAEYLQARRDAFLHSLARLQSACGSAVTILLKVMVGVNSTDLTRLRAVELVLRLAKDGIEVDDFATRLERLEEAHKKEAKKCKRRS